MLDKSGQDIYMYSYEANQPQSNLVLSVGHNWDRQQAIHPHLTK